MGITKSYEKVIANYRTLFTNYYVGPFLQFDNATDESHIAQRHKLVKKSKTR
jgi:hypothetical protein